MDALIERLKDRVRRSPAVEMDAYCQRGNEAGEILPPPPPRPPLPIEAVEACEQSLGFRLPTLVRRLYSEVADGGWGPAWGINRLRQPPVADLEEASLIQDVGVEGLYRLYHMERPGEDLPEYFRYRPEPSIRFCEAGCNTSYWVDCTTDEGPVFEEDPNRDDERDCIRPVADSVAVWLMRWLDEKPWPEERYP